MDKPHPLSWRAKISPEQVARSLQQKYGRAGDFSSFVNTSSLRPSVVVLFALLLLLGRNAAHALDPAALDPTFAAAPQADAAVNALVVQRDGRVVIAGRFTHLNGATRNHIARLNTDGSVDQSFLASGSDADINALALQPDGRIIVGGVFTTFNGANRDRLVRLNSDGTLDASFNSDPGINNQVGSLALQSDGRILVGGQFSQAGLALRNNIARFLANGALDNTFDPGTGANGAVLSIRPQSDGTIFIAGLFTVYAGFSRGGVARLNSDGSLNSSFDPGIAGAGNIFFVTPQADGRVLIGGPFTQVNGLNRSYLARLNADGSVDTSFAPIVNDVVSIAEIEGDGKLLIGGRFTIVNGVSRGALARLFPAGSLDASFDPGTGFTGTLAGEQTEVRALRVPLGGGIYVGGAFAAFNGSTRQGIARLVGGPYGYYRNLSTRAKILTGQKVLIAGFIITGTEPKRLLLRGLGPSLAAAGVSGALADPVLELHDGAGTLLVFNNNWKSDQQAEIQETGAAPSNDAEAALVVTLSPGAYTAVLRGSNNGTGVGLAEIYDIDNVSSSPLANLSSRGFVGVGDQVLIAGLIVGSNNGGPSHTLVRALGPSLSASGISNPLLDPTLQLRDGNGVLLASNDNWQQTQAAEIAATGIAPTRNKESAILIDLPAGVYTAIVAGKSGGTGVALVEVYNLGL